MDCSLIEPELVGFHFGTLDDEVRRGVEEHLCGCASCVRAFVAIKRGLELSEGPLPSEAARSRLRAEVAAELSSRRRPARRTLRAVGRVALPLAMAAALVVALFASGALRRRGERDVAAPAAAVPAVDSIHSAPTSLDVL